MDNLTAIILCGGKGERLRPFTEHAPKPLVPLGGRPILHHLIQFLEQSGVEKFVLCVGYKSEMIRDFLTVTFPNPQRYPCVDSGDVSMTDRLIDARSQVQGRVLVCYGDTLANLCLPELVRFHEQSGGRATLTLYPLQCPFGVVESDDDGKVRSFREKPVLPYWINIGFLLLEPDVLGELEHGSDMPRFLNGLASSGRLRAFRHQGSHLTVNTEKEREHAEAHVAEMLTVP